MRSFRSSSSAILMALAWATTAAGQVIDLPTRPADAVGGAALVEELRNAGLAEREERVVAEVLRGNIPSWLRQMVPVTMTRRVGGQDARVTFWVAPDYLAIGSGTDYLLMPLSPQAAQRIADLTGTSLPTPPMVDAIWQAAKVRLGPDSIAPSAAMVTMPVFADHNRIVRARRDADPSPGGSLVAGHKKDVVLSARLDTLTNRVAIYGWHKPDGQPIQPLNTWHTTAHVDYSHGIRLVHRQILIDGVEHDIVTVLRNPELAPLLSDDGTAGPYHMTVPRSP
jgi:hypothetical protein